MASGRCDVDALLGTSICRGSMNARAGKRGGAWDGPTDDGAVVTGRKPSGGGYRGAKESNTRSVHRGGGEESTDVTWDEQCVAAPYDDSSHEQDACDSEAPWSRAASCCTGGREMDWLHADRDGPRSPGSQGMLARSSIGPGWQRASPSESGRQNDAMGLVGGAGCGGGLWGERSLVLAVAGKGVRMGSGTTSCSGPA